MDLIKVGITHGDMNGIGYEVILKALSDNRIFEKSVFIIYGYSKAAAFYRKNLNLEDANLNVIKAPNEAIPKCINIINCTEDDLKVEMGIATEESGRMAFLALEKAVDDLQKHQIDVLVTAPINKKTIQSDNFNFKGHTEYLEDKAGGKDSLMFFVSDSMRVALVTNHVPVAQVSSTITEDLILKKLNLLNTSLKEDFMIPQPRIAVLALNPHASDNGLIGTEEQTVIIPALNKARENGIVCVGPLAADGFFGSGAYASYDAVLAMYHDQALAPFKIMCMGNGVNYTAGLPFVRTSPTHGTAYDKVGKQTADASSFRHAIYLALDVYQNRKRFAEMTQNPLQIKKAQKS
ncbi:MAG: 4-hydroxythreonine-4-phosphate dehydrogenase PdxA [Paludibacteraceae bacterium]|nr:4-hydroxythreonine-4-phosphate dehydrogenase PdxA [Paludibacteraceae bacterium]